jgi:hypothetical protein
LLGTGVSAEALREVKEGELKPVQNLVLQGLGLRQRHSPNTLSLSTVMAQNLTSWGRHPPSPFRVCFGPNGEIYAPSSVRSPEQGGGGVHKVKVTNLSGTCFKEREYGELLNAHREVRAAGEATFGFSSAAQGGEQSDGKAQMSHALSCYADACSRASDTGGSRQQVKN